MLLFKNKNWTIERINDKEITISNGYDKCHAYLKKRSYFDKMMDLKHRSETNEFILAFDHIICPPYIQKIALEKAIKNIKLLTE